MSSATPVASSVWEVLLYRMRRTRRVRGPGAFADPPAKWILREKRVHIHRDRLRLTTGPPLISEEKQNVFETARLPLAADAEERQIAMVESLVSNDYGDRPPTRHKC